MQHISALNLSSFRWILGKVCLKLCPGRSKVLT